MTDNFYVTSEAREGCEHASCRYDVGERREANAARNGGGAEESGRAAQAPRT